MKLSIILGLTVFLALMTQDASGKRKYNAGLAGRIRRERQPQSHPPEYCAYQGRLGIYGACDQFYVCERAGMKPYLKFCKGKKFFHHQERECRNITKAECKDSMCKTRLDQFPDPHNKENFLICHKLYTEVRQCPSGQIYVGEDGTCVNGDSLKGLLRSEEADSHKSTTTTRPDETGEKNFRNLHPCQYGIDC